MQISFKSVGYNSSLTGEATSVFNHLTGILFLVISLPGFADDCIPTPHRTTGTHYEPVTVQKNDISTGLVVRGQVLAAPDCTPVARARVAHWQAGEDGRYSDRLRAYLFTDADGRFEFTTEWPNLNPPHIHFIVTTEGYETLETQWIGIDRQKLIDFTIVLRRKSGSEHN
jgi:protocatechuate 3,4-dioxygenase beta subunit